MKNAPQGGGAADKRSGAAANQIIADVHRETCPHAPECHRHTNVEDACTFCRACWTVINAHREPNAYSGRGRS